MKLLLLALFILLTGCESLTGPDSDKTYPTIRDQWTLINPVLLLEPRERVGGCVLTDKEILELRVVMDYRHIYWDSTATEHMLPLPEVKNYIYTRNKPIGLDEDEYDIITDYQVRVTPVEGFTHHAAKIYAVSTKRVCQFDYVNQIHVDFTD